MANPQPDKTIRIATEIWDFLCKFRIPGEARQVLDFILRKTYGWNKKEDQIALIQFMEGTGLSKVHVCRMIEKITKMNLIIVTQKGNEIAKTYRFNKDYDTWIALPKKVTLPKKVISITKKGKRSLPKKGTTIDTSTIDTTIDNNPKGLELTVQSYGKIEINEVIEYLKQQQGLTQLDGSVKWNRIYTGHLLKKFKNDVDRIKRYIDFALQDPFHQKNATSVKYLYNNVAKIAMNFKSKINLNPEYEQ